MIAVIGAIGISVGFSTNFNTLLNVPVFSSYIPLNSEASRLSELSS